VPRRVLNDAAGEKPNALCDLLIRVRGPRAFCCLCRFATRFWNVNHLVACPVRTFLAEFPDKSPFNMVLKQTAYVELISEGLSTCCPIGELEGTAPYAPAKPDRDDQNRDDRGRPRYFLRKLRPPRKKADDLNDHKLLHFIRNNPAGNMWKAEPFPLWGGKGVRLAARPGWLSVK